MEPYLEMIIENELNPNLQRLLVVQEEKAYVWFLENNHPIERKSYPYLSDFDTHKRLNIVDFSIENR